MAHRLRVRKKHNESLPPDVIYCGRPSPLGNPFVIGEKDPIDRTIMDRARVIQRFKEYIYSNDLEYLVRETIAPGVRAACWCKMNEECHVDHLLEIANHEIRYYEEEE